MPRGYKTADSTAPACRAAAVTPNDSAVIENTRAVWVGGAGTIVVDFCDGGTNVSITGVPAGSTLSMQITRVYATGTTATGIVALY